MEVKLKGKITEIVSVQIYDLLPDIKDAILKEIGADDGVELHYTSNTTFLTFNVIRNEKQLSRCRCLKCLGVEGD